MYSAFQYNAFQYNAFQNSVNILTPEVQPLGGGPGDYWERIKHYRHEQEKIRAKIEDNQREIEEKKEEIEKERLNFFEDFEGEYWEQKLLELEQELRELQGINSFLLSLLLILQDEEALIVILMATMH